MSEQKSTLEKTKYLKIHLKSGDVINLSEESHDIKGIYSLIIDGYSIKTAKLYIPHNSIEYVEVGWKEFPNPPSHPRHNDYPTKKNKRKQ